jgi:hypothetical protein
VRVGVLEFLHHAVEGHFLLIVEHHGRVVRFDPQRCRYQHRRADQSDESNSDHFEGSLVLSLSVNVKSL